MLIREELQTGWPSQLALRQRVAAYGRIDRVQGFKIGISSKPRDRAALYRHKEPHFREMIVLYKTFSEFNVRNTERELTIWFKVDFECDNKNLGGGGPIGEPPFYLYVVLRERL